MLKRSCAFLLLMVCFAGAAQADIYRCVSEDGTVRFSDTPCLDTAEVFYKENKVSIDEAVALASPLKDLTLNSPHLISEIVAHARIIGNTLFPSEQFNDTSWRRHKAGSRYPHWIVMLYYGKKDNKPKWAVNVNYGVQRKNGVIRIWMHTIYVRLTGTLFDPPSIESAKPLKNLERIKAGKYQVPWWVKR